jgi:hypothetical protein
METKKKGFKNSKHLLNFIRYQKKIVGATNTQIDDQLPITPVKGAIWVRSLISDIFIR